MENKLSVVVVISIHAPRTGSDAKDKLTELNTTLFQSTLPARGATARTSVQKTLRIYFNPRSPHGERRRASLLM